MPSKNYLAEEDELLRSMHKSHSHSEIALVLGRSEQSVRNRAWRLGFVTDRAYSDDEKQLIKNAYESACDEEPLNLSALAKSMNRNKSGICRIAKQMVLSDATRPKSARINGLRPCDIKKLPMFSSKEELGAHISKKAKERIAKNGHPRGMLGKKHTPEALIKISAASSAMAASMTEEKMAEIVMKIAKTKSANGTLVPNAPHGSWKSGWREIGGKKKYYRSRWEANYGRYLEWLKEKGEISDWHHEPETFWFEGIKRGSVSYLPDFRVHENNGSIVYHEVKGWMDARSKTKLDRMARYHPTVKLIVIREKQYKEIEKKLSSLILGWE